MCTHDVCRNHCICILVCKGHIKLVKRAPQKQGTFPKEIWRQYLLTSEAFICGLQGANQDASRARIGMCWLLLRNRRRDILRNLWRLSRTARGSVTLSSFEFSFGQRVAVCCDDLGQRERVGHSGRLNKRWSAREQVARPAQGVWRQVCLLEKSPIFALLFCGGDHSFPWAWSFG